MRDSLPFNLIIFTCNPVSIVLLNVIASSDTFQKKHLKVFLRRADIENPRPKVKDYYFITRKKDLTMLNYAIPKRLQPKRWTVIGNSSTYGKSYLLKEFGSQYKGPVLYTDFGSTVCPKDVNDLMYKTIHPLFFNWFLFTSHADTSPQHRFELLKEAAKELADEGRPVLWILDSLCTIIDNANNKDIYSGNRIEYYKSIADMFNLSYVMIPVPVCSSATAIDDLKQAHHAMDHYTRPFYVSFTSDENELKQLVRSLMIPNGSHPVDEALVQEIVDVAGSNLHRFERLATSADIRYAIKAQLDAHVTELRTLKASHKNAYDLLLKIDNGETIPYKPGQADHKVLLSRQSGSESICAVNPSGCLTFAAPVTKTGLQILTNGA